MTRDDLTASTGTHATVSERVVEAVAREVGVEPTELDSLYETLDPDALNALFAERPGRSQRSAVRVTFEYVGHPVTVSEDGAVEVGAPVAPSAVTQRDAPSPAPDGDTQATD